MSRRVQTIGMLFFSVVVVGGLLFVRSAITPKASLASIVMLDVGQGDSFLITSASGRRLLIDGGRDSKVLGALAKVMPIGARRIDVIIATHPDADHIGGLPLVIDNYKVGLFLTSEVSTDTQTFHDLFEALKDNHVPSYYARHGMVLMLEQSTTPTTFSVLFPDRPTTNWETNTASVVGRLQVGERSALFTGDSPSTIEHFLARALPSDVDVDILKLGHHGSKYSSSDEYLTATSPVLALISAGKNNRYGHPAPEVLARLTAHRIPSVDTMDIGTVTLETDGIKWWKK